MAAGKRMTGEERRGRILDAALDVFAEKGFHGARSREIARRAGISETLVFRHFTNKERLFEEAMNHLFGGHRVADEIEAHLAETDDLGVFAGIARHMLEHTREDPRILRLHLFQFLDRMHGPRGGDGGFVGSGDLERFLADYIARRVEQGAFHAADPGLSAKLFLYWIFMAIADRDLGLFASPLDGDDTQLAETLAHRFLHGITRPD